MEKYNSVEVKELLKMLRSINKKARNNTPEPTRLEKQIKYLEQRLNFFNPTREMLAYIINQAGSSKIKLSPELLRKLKEEYASKA